MSDTPRTIYLTCDYYFSFEEGEGRGQCEVDEDGTGTTGGGYEYGRETTRVGKDEDMEGRGWIVYPSRPGRPWSISNDLSGRVGPRSWVSKGPQSQEDPDLSP